MRFATILALVGLPLAALSQPCDPAQTSDVCPDTTDWHRYFPLEVGNSWQYRDSFAGEPVTHWSWRIVGQEEAGGQTYFALERCDETEDGAAACAEPVLLRYDEEHAMIVRRGGDEETWWPELPCRLDVAFHEADEGEVYACTGPGTEGWHFAPAEGAYGAAVPVPPDTVAGDTRKRFSQLVVRDWELYAGLGATRLFYELQGEPSRLVHAFVGGRQVGTPAFAACDPYDPAAYHVPCPDTTDWRRYYPLEVGNEWQYAYEWCDDGETCRWGLQIVGSEEVEGMTYFLRRYCREDEGENVTCLVPHRVRYDEEARTVVTELSDGTLYDVLGVCSLASPFNLHAFGVECVAEGVDGSFLTVLGAYDGTFSLGEGPSLQGSWKTFDSLGGGGWYFAGIGPTGGVGELSAETHLRYARVGGVTYGTPIFAFPTADEPDASAPAAFALRSVYPNPARGAATVTYTLDRPQDVTLALLDVLGRVVRTEEVRVQAAGAHEARLATDALPSGLYLVRLRGDGVEASRRLVVLR